MIKILKKSPGILTFKLVGLSLYLKEGINELQEDEFIKMTEHSLYETLAKELNLTVIEDKKNINSSKIISNKKNTNKSLDNADS